MTTTEMRVMRRLVTDTGRYVTYRGIYDIVHYPGFMAGTGVEGYKSNVRSMIKRMRHKFRVIDPTFCSIKVALPTSATRGGRSSFHSVEETLKEIIVDDHASCASSCSCCWLA